MRVRSHRWLLLLATLISSQIGATAAPEKITFPSGDDLLITADVYIQCSDRQTPFIVLFHQASWSRGEYNETAPRLNGLGFNCMAIDQRSGGSINGVTNETKQRATIAGKGTTFIDAIPDMLAAIAYAKANYADGAVIGFGSSYSSALILKLAGDDASLVDGVASFSPGEYFTNLGQPSNYIRTSAANIAGPVFITSRRNEQANWQSIFDAISSAEKVSFLPTTSGQHGSRALWAEFSDSDAYWRALEPYLAQWLPSLAKFRAAHGLAEDGSDDLSSAAGDGVTNLIKYALGIAPADQAAAGDLPAVLEVEGSNYFQLQRLKNRTDIRYSVETSRNPNATEWDEIWNSEDNAYAGGTDPVEQVMVRLPDDLGELFARLRITVPSPSP